VLSATSSRSCFSSLVISVKGFDSTRHKEDDHISTHTVNSVDLKRLFVTKVVPEGLSRVRIEKSNILLSKERFKWFGCRAINSRITSLILCSVNILYISAKRAKRSFGVVVCVQVGW
jgi:hypothetical protein